jgi:peptidoglycan/xylan/chitin deacetylase (PgdA/CDA1 family)
MIVKELAKQDLAGLVLHYSGLLRIVGARPWTRKIPAARVLAFHDVPAVASGRFREMMEYVKMRTNVVDLDDVVAGRLSSDKPNVAITFDDGYRGWFENALGILRALEIPATFFVCSGFVGLNGVEEREFLSKRLKVVSDTSGSISVAGLKGLANAGFSIGGHTVSHVALPSLPSAAAIRDEIERDKEALERMLGRRLDYFAYPFGFYSGCACDVPALVRSAGYRGAVTVEAGVNGLDMKPYCLRRDLVNPLMPLPVFKARISGAHDWVRAMRRALLNQIKSKG